MKKIISTLAFVLGVVFFVSAQEKVEVKGTVKNERGTLIENAMVTIKDLVNKTETPVWVGKNGSYSATVTEGKYVLKFRAPGYAPKSVIAQVVGNTALDIDLVKIENSKTSRL